MSRGCGGMFRKDKDKDKVQSIDLKKLNDVIGLSKGVLNVLYIILIVVGIYAGTMLIKEWKLFDFLLELLRIVAPLFIGLFIAWLFDPVVKWFQRKGLKRGFGAAIVYAVMFGIILLIVCMIVPMLSDQVNDFVGSLPGIFDTVKGWIDGIFDRLGEIQNLDAKGMKADLFKQLEDFAGNLTSSLPGTLVTVLKGAFSGIGAFVVGLIIGFFLLVSFDNVNDTFITLVPRRMQKDARDVMNEVNTSLRSFVQGALFDCTFVFIITSIGLWLVGLKAPLLFGLFCGITNIIPYAGPYIGGAPAVIVGFSQGTAVGILSLVVIVVIQFLEGNFLQPLIMSKTTKLHPVTIMLGLLVFGHFWGIFGMIVSTPLIAAIKSILMYFDEKYDIIKWN